MFNIFEAAISTVKPLKNGKLLIQNSSINKHEYAQDAMSYVRHYGAPDLFITFTCNLQWTEI